MWARVVIGVILALVGVVWLGQGIGLIKGSFMTGEALWAVIGAVALDTSLVLLTASLAARMFGTRRRRV